MPRAMQSSTVGRGGTGGGDDPTRDGIVIIIIYIYIFIIYIYIDIIYIYGNYINYKS